MSDRQEMSSVDLPRRRPPTLQITLRGLFVIVTLIAMIFAAYQMKAGWETLALIGLFSSALGIWGAYQSNGKFSWFWAIVGLICVCLLVNVIPSQDSRHVPSLRSLCANNLRQINLAFQSYNAAHKQLPPLVTRDTTGTPLHSWRTMILPFLGEQQFYATLRLNEPWNSAFNKPLVEKNLEMYHCPLDRDAAEHDTSYVAIVGQNTAWSPGKATRMRFIKQPSKTILLVEMKNSGIHWAEPRDLDLENLPSGVTQENLVEFLSTSHEGRGFHAAFADGSVIFIPATIPRKTFEALLDADADKSSIHF